MSFKETMQDFKAFAAKGNVVDMAVGVIIGGAFGSIVTSLVNDVIMPVVSLATGGLDFKELFIAMDGNHYASLQEALDANAAVLQYGAFINKVIDFLIIALVIFFMLRFITKLKKKEETPVEPAPTTKICPYCKTEIHIDAVRCPHCTAVLDAE